MFGETPERASRLMVDSPVLSRMKFRKLLAIGKKIPSTPPRSSNLNYEPGLGLRRAIEIVTKKPSPR